MLYRDQLFAIVRADTQLMQQLAIARGLALRDWYLAAGCIRNLVWDTLHGHAEPSGEQDIDFICFDPDRPPFDDTQLQATLHGRYNEPWEVVNQAHVHYWYRDAAGQTTMPLTSTLDGLSRWPETATCIGLRLEADDSLTLAAPWGLDDLFEMRWRRNPLFADATTVARRAKSKRVRERWPLVQIDTDDIPA